MLKYKLGPLWALLNGFVALGAVGSVLMARQPEFVARWGLDNAEWGWVLFAGGLGGVLAYPVNRWVLARWGSRVMLARFGLAGGVVLASIPWLPGLPGLLVGLFAQGMIYNGVGVAINHQAAEWELRQSTRMMGRLHATFYVGNVLSAFLSSILAALGVGLALHMAAVGLAVAAIHRFVAANLEPAPAEHAQAAPPPHVPLELYLGTGLLFGSSIVLEHGMMGWSSAYLSQELKAGPGVAGLGLAFFSGAMALGRMFSDGFVTRHGPRNVVRRGAIVSAIALTLAAMLGSVPVAMLAFGAVGLGLAAAAPVVFSAVGRIGGEALAFVSGIGALGGLLGPLLLGRVASFVSLNGVLVTLAAVSVLIAWQARVLGAQAERPMPLSTVRP
ncbi:MFS transporter [Azoarcus sp. KH32C]|uniref:MFS transporter n=1 Tax=Azoarcus sp. KH32C TaxID=748247 RepID=UPI0002386EE7|nr:MFS transporter [Azoarcus sp. KH32C]BAL24978.1 hypothetical protein AZKH_2672 [Azoarcus sp. KH32C]